jgi:hypothetical protein
MIAKHVERTWARKVLSSDLFINQKIKINKKINGILLKDVLSS